MYRLSDIKIRDNLSEEQVIGIALKKYKINTEEKEIWLWKKRL